MNGGIDYIEGILNWVHCSLGMSGLLSCNYLKLDV